ncbi:MAG: hypothetical protein ABIY50_10850 [Ignavibacteria bacterium]
MAKNNEVKKEYLGKYFLLGTVTAVILFIVFYVIRQDESSTDEQTSYHWSPESDSAFVKDCYNKYRSQIKDNVSLQGSMKGYCRCMLGKIKSKYGEFEIDNMTDTEIKQWDTECRQSLTPDDIQQK